MTNDPTSRLRFVALACVLLIHCLLNTSQLTPSLQAQSPDTLGLLRLAGGDHIPGRLADPSNSNDDETDPDTAKQLAWQYSGFSAPLQFELTSISGASFPKPENTKPATGLHSLELAQGNRLYGEILDADAWTIRVRTSDFGDLTVLRSAVKRVSMWDDGASVLFAGPGAVDQWKTGGNNEAWQSGGGQLRTETENVDAFRNIELPNIARIEIELSWESKPNFVLAIGVDAKNSDESDSAAFRIEVWDDEVVLLRELDDIADVISLGEITDLDGLLRLTLELHQNKGRAIARSAQGKRLGEFTLPANDYPDVQPGVRLSNLAGNVSLDSFTVMLVNESNEIESSGESQTLFLSDGAIRSGTWDGVRDGVWLFTEEGVTSPLAGNQVSSLELGQSFREPNPSDSAEPVSTPETQSTDVAAQIVTHGGVLLGGTIASFDDGRLNLRHDAIEELVSFQNDSIARISFDDSQRAESTDLQSILGRLKFAGGQLTGGLVDTEVQTVAAALRFAPRGANPVNLTTGFTGRMVYRETPPPESAKQRRVREQREAAEQRVVQRRQKQGGVFNALARAFGNNSGNRNIARIERAMHLRSGEVIPCDVKTIDENGIVFTSEMTDQTRLPQDQVRAITFTAGCRDPEVEAARRDRLLTVPRIRKKNRPTHLIVAANDDMLRCRLVRLDEKELVVETRLEKITIPRSVIAQIIWLKEENDDEAEDDAEEKPPATQLAVRAVLRNGNRMSLIANAIEDSILIGEHPLLGESRIKLGDVNELLIGIDISEPGVAQPYNGWQLKDAPEPIIAEAGGGGGGASGMTSALVGKEAPDFTLDLLDGGRFNIAEQRGKVVVLDFWATWCGPCLQAMPVIEETVAEFDENDVRLVAVNLQETAEPIRGTLERLKVSPEVALDIDGVAAARYQADAIPQTVVIGRDGTITRLFVGGGGQLAESLRTAIQDAIDEKKQ